MRTLLIIGAGDIARRALPLLRGHWRVLALVRSAEKAADWRALGALPILADLDDSRSLRRIAGLADAILYTAPPPEAGLLDPRLRKVLSQLAKTPSLPQRIVYISTSGVYGNASGQWLDECSPLAPQSPRAQRRVDAERQLRAFAMLHGCALTVLRAPGIYAANRLPLSRFTSQAPLITASEDSIGNHIHADDLARLSVAALGQQRGGIRVYNACDSQPLAVGDWYDRLADTLGYPRLPRLPREQVRQQVSPGLWSFLAESRRLRNTRLLRELMGDLRYPTVEHLLRELPTSAESTTTYPPRQ
ncbi:SDR family oxidoreductase [Vogesella sp. LIG4]|uniref:SDR family oxidoreductase n=1 Tax=Vogesella sp. LIG4 TaxID=1192162 RepID=UPI00081FAD79|nr:SDR family oxidoreductase [Vogesella sp. LIG4]SCK16947.1 Nucleoside-diphosphate-sugar epimerase [Vogesella sp. LIG4]